MNEQIEKLLKEVEELKENQKKMTEKMDKMQQIIDQIQEDIYEFGDPYEDEEDGMCRKLLWMFRMWRYRKIGIK